MINEDVRYDYIIAGAGCAGLSLLRRMMQHSFFDDKKILLVDKIQKNSNDRTWCFWEQQHGLFEDIVHHKWQQVDFYSSHFSARYDLEPYEYKMIRGIDLYNVVLKEAAHRSNITIIQDEVLAVTNNADAAILKTRNNEYSAVYVFNSIIFNDWKKEALQQPETYVLLQHFKGWLIETSEPVFNSNIATFMDFRIEQNHETTFVYVLPLSASNALIEYTVFSSQLLSGEQYDDGLKNYIEMFIKPKNYTVTHTEFGVIPMTNYKFLKADGRIINIGTAGSQTKASSGYTFQFIQKQSERLIDALIHEKELPLKETFDEQKFALYDSVLLNVLSNKKMTGEQVFTQLFRNNSVQLVFKFLDNETSFKEDFKIMNSVSLSSFLPSAVKEITKLFTRFLPG